MRKIIPLLAGAAAGIGLGAGSAQADELIGGANIVDGRIVAVQDGRAQVELGPVGLEIEGSGAAPGAAAFVIRPETVEAAEATAAGAFAATVLRGGYLGARYEVLLENPFGTIAANRPTGGNRLGACDLGMVRLNPETIAALPAG